MPAVPQQSKAGFASEQGVLVDQAGTVTVNFNTRAANGDWTFVDNVLVSGWTSLGRTDVAYNHATLAALTVTQAGAAPAIKSVGPLVGTSYFMPNTLDTLSGGAGFREKSSAPGMWFEELGTAKGALFVLYGGIFTLQRRATAFGAWEANPFSIDITAPTGSLEVTATGEVVTGVGLSSTDYISAAGIITANTSDSLSGGGFREKSSAPGMWFEENGTAKGALFVLNGGAFTIQRRATAFGAWEANVFSVNMAAPTQSFEIDSDGVVRIGKYLLANVSGSVEGGYREKGSAPGFWLEQAGTGLGAFLVLNSDVVQIQRRATSWGAFQAQVCRFELATLDAYFGRYTHATRYYVGTNGNIFSEASTDTATDVRVSFRPAASTTIAGLRFATNNTGYASIDATTFNAGGTAVTAKILQLNGNGGAVTVGTDPGGSETFRVNGSISTSAITLGGVSLATTLAGKEPALGNPASDGYVLASTAAGVRSWVAPGVANLDPRGATNTRLISTGITADASFRLGLYSDGTIGWADGAAAVDTNLYRSAAGALQTDGTFTTKSTVSVCGLRLSTATASGVGNYLGIAYLSADALVHAETRAVRNGSYSGQTVYEFWLKNGEAGLVKRAWIDSYGYFYSTDGSYSMVMGGAVVGTTNAAAFSLVTSNTTRVTVAADGSLTSFNTSVRIGTDPGGSQALRVGGDAVINGQIDLPSNNVNAINSLYLHNADGASYATISVCGTAAYGLTSWIKSTVLESVGAGVGEGSIVLSSYYGDFVVQTGNRVRELRYSRAGVLTWSTDGTSGSKLFAAVGTGGQTLYGYCDSGGVGITRSDPYTATSLIYLTGTGIDFYSAAVRVAQVDSEGVKGLTVVATGGGSSISLLAGSVDHCYLSFYPRTAAPGTRGGYLGYPGVGATYLTLANELAGFIQYASPQGHVFTDATYTTDPGGSETIRTSGGIRAGNIFGSLITAYTATAAVGATQFVAKGVQGGYGAGLSAYSPLSVSGVNTEMGHLVFDGEAAWSSADINTQRAYFSLKLNYKGVIFSPFVAGSVGGLTATRITDIPVVAGMYGDCNLMLQGAGGGSVAALGFHRPGFSGAAIYHGGDGTQLLRLMRWAGGDYRIYHSGTSDVVHRSGEDTGWYQAVVHIEFPNPNYGLYWSHGTGAALFKAGNNYLYVRTSGAVAYADQSDTIRGFVYHDAGAGNFGLLNAPGNWILRINGTTTYFDQGQVVVGGDPGGSANLRSLGNFYFNKEVANGEAVYSLVNSSAATGYHYTSLEIGGYYNVGRIISVQQPTVEVSGQIYIQTRNTANNGWNPGLEVNRLGQVIVNAAGDGSNPNFTVYGGAATQGWIRISGGDYGIQGGQDYGGIIIRVAGVSTLTVDASTTAGDLRLLVYDVNSGLLKRVTVGAADSGGTGYRMLRIAN